MRFYGHKDGEIQIKTGFLFFPKEIGTEIRWLETATWAKRYYRFLSGPGGFWIDKRWEDDINHGEEE